MAATISAYGAGALATGSVTIPFPTTVAGDRVFALIAGVGTTVTTVPTGWTLKSGVNASTARRLELFYMNAAATGTEGGTTQAFTRTGGDACTAVMIAVSGAASSGDPFEALATQTGVQSAGSDATLPGITTLTANALILAVAAHGTGNTSGGGSVSGTDPTFVDDKDVVAHVPILTRDRLTFNNASATTNTVTWPAWGAGTTRDTGAVAIAHVTVKSGTATVTGTGWTQLVAPQGDAASPASRLHTLYHVIDVADVNAGGASGTLPTLTISGTAVKVAAVCQIWWGADPTSPNQSGSGQVNASSTSSSAPTRTGTQTHNAAVYATGPSLGVTLSTAPSTFTLPTSGTIAATGGSSATQCGVGIAYKLLVSTTATGVLTGTLSGAAPSAGVSYILNALGSSSTATNGQHLAIYSGTKTAAGAIAAGRTETQPFAYNTNWQTILLAVKPGATDTTVAPGAGALSLSGFAPSVVIGIRALAGAAALALTGFAPTVAVAPAGANVTPGVGAVALAGFAPTASVSNNQAVSPSVGALSLTGFAPSVAIGVRVAPSTGALALAGFAPTIGVSNNQAVTPAVGALALAGAAPTVAVSDNRIVLPAVGALSLTGYAPSAVVGVRALANVAVLTLTGFAPTIAVTAHQAVTPGLGALSLAGFAPTVSAGNATVAAPGVGALALAGFAPTATTTANRIAAPGVGALTLSGFAPSVVLGVRVTADVASLALTGFAPTATATNHQIVTPSTGALALTGYAPVIVVGKRVLAGVAALTLTGFAPTVTRTAHQFPAPATGTLTLSGYAPSVNATDYQIVRPGAGLVTLTGYAPVAATTDTIVALPGVALLTLAGYAPTVVVAEVPSELQALSGIVVVGPKLTGIVLLEPEVVGTPVESPDLLGDGELIALLSGAPIARARLSGSPLIYPLVGVLT